MIVEKIKKAPRIYSDGKANIKKLRVAAYCRVSTDSEDQMNSYNSQKQYYTDLISKNENYEMVGIYADPGITGTSVAKREEFQRLISDAKEGKIDLIMTKSISRFARNTLDTMYVHLLVNPTEKKMVIRQCDEDAKDAVRWCRVNKKLNKRVPRKILCRLFAAKVYDLLKWFADYKYKLQGNIVKTPEERLIVFDLTETEVYSPIDKDGIGKGQTFFPEDWKNSFGMSVEQHHQSLVLNLLDGYQRLEVQQKRQNKGKKVTKDDITSKQQSIFDIKDGEK